MRSAALALLVLISSHAVSSTHILGGKALVNGIASGVTGLSNEPTQDSAAMLSVPANFSAGASTGNLFCLPKYSARDIDIPKLTCPNGYNANGTTSIGGIACVKQAYVERQNCFRSMQCLANGQNMQVEDLCMPGDVRSALIGMLVVFKVKAMLPFTILPILKTALTKAVTSPIVLPAKLISAKVTAASALANAVLNKTAGSGAGLGGVNLGDLGVAAAAGGLGGFGNKSSSSSSSLLELLAQLEVMKHDPAALLPGLGLVGKTAGSFGGFGDKGNSSLPELLAQLPQLPQPQLQIPKLFNKSTSMADNGPAAALNTDLGMLLAAAQLAAMQKGALNKTDGSGLGSVVEAENTFGGLTDKVAQVSLLISQLAQLQKFNQSSGLSGLDLAAGLNHNAAGPGEVGFGSVAGGDKDLNTLLAQFAKQKPSNQSLGQSSMRLAAANSLGGLGAGFADKNSSSGLIQLLEGLKPSAAAMLASLIGSGSTGGFEGFADQGSNASSVVQLLTQLEALKRNPAALLAALTDKNSTLQLMEMLAQMPVFNPAGALAALGLSGFSKNLTLPQLLSQIERLKPNPAAFLAGLFSGASSSFGGFSSDKNNTLPMLVLLALQKPDPLAVLAGLSSSFQAGGFGGIGGDKNFMMPLLAQLKKFNMSLPDLPGFSINSMTVVPEMSIKLGGGNASFPLSLARQAASLTFAGNDVVGALMRGANPMDIFTKSLLNVNMNEIMNFVPQINSWVSEHLQNLTHVNEITAQISANFPDCIHRCCKNQRSLETSFTVPTLGCSPGLKLNPITKLCVGDDAGYGQCPSSMSRCPASLPSGQPICVSELDSFGLDTCKVLLLAQHTLPQHQCPS